jgi:hypothetical protein
MRQGDEIHLPRCPGSQLPSHLLHDRVQALGAHAVEATDDHDQELPTGFGGDGRLWEHTDAPVR